jgi:hypothetical protein
MSDKVKGLELFKLPEGELRAAPFVISNSHGLKSHVAELFWLVEKIKDEKGMIAELGSFMGLSAIFFANNFRHVVSIDSWVEDRIEETFKEGRRKRWTGVEEIFDHNMRLLKNVSKVKMDSAKAAELFSDGLFEAVYVDAAHDYESVVRDLEAWRPKVKRWMCGHDLDYKSPGVERAVKDVLGGFDDKRGTLWLKEVKDES